MQKYTIASIIIISLLIIRFVLNGLSFLDAFNLRVLLFLFLFTASILGILFSKRWGYLLSSFTAVSEFSIASVVLDTSLILGSLATNGMIVAFSVWMFYKFDKKSRKR